MKSTYRLVLIAFLALACIADLAAQSNASDAALEGYVRDATGAAVPSAQVTAREIHTNVIQRATTDSGGYYRFPLLQVGDYEVGVSASGFRAWLRSGLNLTVGQKAHVDVALEVGPATERIDVSASASQADTGIAGTGGVLEKDAV
ncbi:MAG TPA: carboxypeptidase-like regulatory domain-containing protein, partial [Bryobacteraceae bacterium]|nr:carboxypeptidase-like regulatory domain-containing protein [Bryobacteraceae bacterium]